MDLEVGNKINNLLEFHSYIDGDGCHHDNEKELFHYYLLKLCGCGTPNETYNFCVNILKNIKSDENIPHIIINDSWDAATIITFYLERKGLVEHGSSIGGAWLTKEGKEKTKDILKTSDSENFDNTILLQFYSFDSQPHQGVSDLSNLISKNVDNTIRKIKEIFIDLELIDKDLNLTNDGEYIVKYGHKEED